MKRRKKKPENETEATGKVGQQKPLVDEAHPQPLVPAYNDVEPEAPRRPRLRRNRRQPDILQPNEPRMETEVQPESPSMPPPGVPEHRPAQQAGKVQGDRLKAWLYWLSACRDQVKQHGLSVAA